MTRIDKIVPIFQKLCLEKKVLSFVLRAKIRLISSLRGGSPMGSRVRAAEPRKRAAKPPADCVFDISYLPIASQKHI